MSMTELGNIVLADAGLSVIADGATWVNFGIVVHEIYEDRRIVEIERV